MSAPEVERSLQLLCVRDQDGEYITIAINISNLSNIFGITVEKKESKATPSLRYVSPKQTKLVVAPTSANGKDASTDSANDWKVQVAKVVTAYKLFNKENISQGKIGLAVLKNINDERLRLILYRSKNNVLSTCTLKDDTIIYRNDLYLQFHDDLQLFWSILFERQDLDEILKYVGYAVQVRSVQDTNSEPKSDPPSNEQTTANTKSESVAEENSSDERLQSTKANLLSRMAKMGQPLPKLSATPVTTTDMSDSSDTETKKKVIPKPVVAVRKSKAQPLVPVVHNNMQVVASSAYGNLIASTSINPSGMAVADSQYMNILLAENRTQSSELRMNIFKLETKIEKVLDKIDILSSCKNGEDMRDSKEDEILGLEEKILELKKDNRSLKLRIKEIEESNHLSTSIPVPQEDFNSFKELLNRLNIDPEVFTQPIDVYKELIDRLNSENSVLSAQLSETQKSLEANKFEIETMSSEFCDKEKLIIERESIHEKQLQDLNAKLQMANDKCKGLSDKLSEHSNQTEQVVKEIMNNLYQKLAEQFGQRESFTSIEVTKMCAHAIKTETNNVIKKKS